MRDRLRREGRAFRRPGRRRSSPRPSPPRPPTPRRCSRRRTPTASPSRSCSTRPTPPSARRSRSSAWPASRASTSCPTCTRPAPTCPRRSVSWWPPPVATSRRPRTSRCTSPRSARACLTRDEVDAETVENERRVAEATAKEEGKPEAALSRIVEGRVNGYFKENVLLEQPLPRSRRRPWPRCSRGRRRRQGLRALPRREPTTPPHHAASGCRPLTERAASGCPGGGGSGDAAEGQRGEHQRGDGLTVADSRRGRPSRARPPTARPARR